MEALKHSACEEQLRYIISAQQFLSIVFSIAISDIAKFPIFNFARERLKSMSQAQNSLACGDW